MVKKSSDDKKKSKIKQSERHRHYLNNEYSINA